MLVSAIVPARSRRPSFAQSNHVNATVVFERANAKTAGHAARRSREGMSVRGREANAGRAWKKLSIVLFAERGMTAPSNAAAVELCSPTSCGIGILARRRPLAEMTISPDCQSMSSKMSVATSLARKPSLASSIRIA